MSAADPAMSAPTLEATIKAILVETFNEGAWNWAERAAEKIASRIASVPASSVPVLSEEQVREVVQDWAIRRGFVTSAADFVYGDGDTEPEIISDLTTCLRSLLSVPVQQTEGEGE
jgi:hypothetical protein